MNPPTNPCVILVVLDGWGLAPPGQGNAVASAHTPNMRRFWVSYPHTQLSASGEAVGLPRGEVGNTETGHLNLGAGRIVYQDLARINMSIADGSLFQNKLLLSAIEHANTYSSNLHLMGLIGAGGVHSNIEHLYALIQLAHQKNFSRLYLHLFTDGRDSPPTSALTYISQLQSVIQKEGVGQIASLMGRYWAMDRDYRWERTEKAYKALTASVGHLVKTPTEAVHMSYEQGKTDEFMEPCLLTGPDGKPIAQISDNDAVIFFNFRIDRPRQLTKAFTFENFEQANNEVGFDPYTVEYSKKHTDVKADQRPPVFNRGQKLKNLYFVTMTEYSKSIAAAGVPAAFPPESVTATLGRAIADNNLKQLRVAESEKERFVTYYFNGQQELPLPGEDRLIISSPKVATYDLKPEMAARDLVDALLGKIWQTNPYSFILLNFANVDMVGHTGNIGAAVTACQVVDECLGKLASYVNAYNSVMVITADHGNAEEMVKPQSQEIDTEHSSYPVPFVVVSKKFVGNSVMLRSGRLADVAPTILKLLNLAPPFEMSGRNLLEGVVA